MKRLLLDLLIRILRDKYNISCMNCAKSGTLLHVYEGICCKDIQTNDSAHFFTILVLWNIYGDRKDLQKLQKDTLRIDNS